MFRRPLLIDSQQRLHSVEEEIDRHRGHGEPRRRALHSPCILAGAEQQDVPAWRTVRLEALEDRKPVVQGGYAGWQGERPVRPDRGLLPAAVLEFHDQHVIAVHAPERCVLPIRAGPARLGHALDANRRARHGVDGGHDAPPLETPSTRIMRVAAEPCRKLLSSAYSPEDHQRRAASAESNRTTTTRWGSQFPSRTCTPPPRTRYSPPARAMVEETLARYAAYAFSS